MKHLPAIAALSILALGYWGFVCAVAGVQEPWDAERYWSVAYPSSLLLAGLIGFALGKRGWLAGVVLTFAQFPIILFFTGISAMSLFALAILCLLAIPAVLISTLAGRLGARR